MFPKLTAPWLHLLPKRNRWQMHRPLADVATMVQSRLQAEAGEANGDHAQQVDSLINSAKQHLAQYLLQVRLCSAHAEERVLLEHILKSAC